MSRADVRISEQGQVFDAQSIRDFIHCALDHEAATDAVHELLYDHVERGRLHPDVIRNTLRPIIDEILNTATPEDWMQVTTDLIAEAKDALGKDTDPPE